MPCGKCRACLAARSREWALRLLHELDYHSDAVFVTLTYDDQWLPGDGSLERDAFPAFIKRVRSELPDRRLKYYMCGEYGGQTGRPHYHAIIFGLGACLHCRCCSKAGRRGGRAPGENTDCSVLESCWPFGHVDVGMVEPASIRYVAGYLGKNAGEVEYGGREPCFSLKSQGIGLKWLMDHLEEVERDFGIRTKNGIVGLPRYYQKKLLDLHADCMFDYGCFMRSIAARRGLDRDSQVMDWLNDRYSVLHIGYGWRRMLKQHDQNLAARAALQERKL